MYTINKLLSNNAVNTNLKALRREDKALALTLRKVYTNIIEKEYVAIPTTSEELVAVYNGKEDITGIEAGTLLMSIEFKGTEEGAKPVIEIEIEDIEPSAYDTMSVQELTNVLLADLGSEITSEVVNMTTGLKVKLDMLDELKALLRDSFSDIRVEVLTARLANALALTKEAKGSSLETVGGNLAVYEYLNSDRKVVCDNYLFMADVAAEATASLDILVLEAALKSYKSQVALGTLPIPPKELTLAVTKAIKGIVEVKEDNKVKVQDMKF